MKTDAFEETEGCSKWVIFTDTGKATVTHGSTITQAVANWRKAKRVTGEPVGVILCGYSKEFPFSIHGTDVFGVLCCVHRPEGAGTKTA